MNPYCSTICEICGARASASLRPTLEIDNDDADEAEQGSAVGSVFLPLRGCSTTKKENSRGGANDTDSSSELLKSTVNSLPRRENASQESQSLGYGGNGKSDSEEKKNLFTVLRPCSNKRKDREEGRVNGDRSDVGSSSGFKTVKTLNNSVEPKPLGMFLIIVSFLFFVFHILIILVIVNSIYLHCYWLGFERSALEEDHYVICSVKFLWKL